jgi:hypothetical protein
MKDSNVYVPGTSLFELRAADRDGGSHVEMIYTREFTSTPKGVAANLFYRTAGPPLFRGMIKAVLAEIEKDVTARA